ncbi:tRNA methyltransferase, has a role in tRNA modification [Coemansia sp. Benny D115]|nr:tRNA methyltransferase, has a role in tRNA modification [Coemansia sp. Benny D115]
MKRKEEVIADTLALCESDKEAQYVHAVYNEIAGHFSDTRFKPWPVVDRYLRSLDVGSVGIDVGCGNGKYLRVRTGDIFMMGADRSESLVDICRERQLECLVADGLGLPYRSNAFDFAISIAVIHHFSSAERRLQAVSELLRIVRPGGTVLIFAWALEQHGRRKFDPNTQDVLVPWVVPGSRSQSAVMNTDADSGTSTEANPNADKVYHRYYHLFCQGELEDLVSRAGGCVISESGYDKDNWYVIAHKTK